MFTGIIEEVGQILAVTPIANGKALTINAHTVLAGTRPGDSIAVDGVCLTVTDLTAHQFTVQAVGETLEKTTLGTVQQGQHVNLERALAVGDRLGGHFVQGHVNGTGTIQTFRKRGDNYLLEVSLPSHLRKYVILEGSIAIDGISLTVAHLAENRVGINIIPHTMSHTNLQYKQVGQSVNIEVDLIAKYIENLLRFSSDKGITENLLKQWGYSTHDA